MGHTLSTRVRTAIGTRDFIITATRTPYRYRYMGYQYANPYRYQYAGLYNYRYAHPYVYGYTPAYYYRYARPYGYGPAPVYYNYVPSGY